MDEEDGEPRGKISVFNCIRDACEFLKENEIETELHYHIARESKAFCKIDENTDGGTKIFWESDCSGRGAKIPFDGVPYTLLGFQIRHCLHGPDRHRKQKSAYHSKQKSSGSKKRQLLQPSKKMDCPAKVSLRAIMKYPEYKIQEPDSKWQRQKTSKLLREKLSEEGQNVQRKLEIHLFLPDIADHRNHLTGEFSGLSQPVDEIVISRIHSLVHEGVRSVAEIKRHLRLFVKENISSGNTISELNRRFYPTNKDIRNHMYRALRFCQFSTEDQENVLQQVKEWETSKPDDHFFFRPNTNVGYSIVASFVVANENREHIQEGLRKVKEWNPNWHPKFFMTDFDEREIWAIENTFDDCDTLLCDFHREQAWTRWLKDKKHGLSAIQNEVLDLLRKIAHSPTEKEYHTNVDDLKSSSHWVDNTYLQKWFQGRWLNNAKRWVRCFRNSLLNIRVSTTNGLERQHHEFKKRYLANYTDGSLSSMLTILISNFLPDAYKRYIQYNVESMEAYRKYSTQIPEYLHNRPKLFLEHCMKRIPPKCLYLPSSAISSLPNGEFQVPSTDGENHYVLNLDGMMPSCSCADWNRYHLPCKHMLSIFFHYPGYSWEFLHPEYTECPHFNIDRDILQRAQVTNVSAQSIQTEPRTTTVAAEVVEESGMKRPGTQCHVRLHCIQLLKNILSSVYLVHEQDELQPVYDSLKESWSLITGLIPKDKGLPLRTTAFGLKRRTGSQKYRSLPSRRKRKRSKQGAKSTSGVHGRGQKKASKRKVNRRDTEDPNLKVPTENVDLSDRCGGHGESPPFPEENHSEREGIDLIEPGTSERRSEETHYRCGSQDSPVENLESSVIDDIWRQTPVGHLCSKIGPYKLSDRSFYCLRTMLPDEIIDAYTYLVSSSQENKHVYHVNCTIMTAIFNGNAELHNYLSEVPRLKDFDVICGALNEGSCHWSLVYIMPKDEILFYINPLGESFSRLRRIEEKWKELLFGREDLGIMENTTEWFVHTKEHARQKDSTSCGVLVLKFLERMLTGEDLNINITACGITETRKSIGQILLKNSGDLDSYCRHCYTKESQERGALVRCTQCKDGTDKYFHATCGCSLHPANDHAEKTKIMSIWNTI